MKQKILSLLQSSNTPLTISDLVMKLKIINKKEQELLLSDLELLKNNQIIFENNQNQIYVGKTFEKLMVGNIQITAKGTGFIKSEFREKDFRVNNQNVNGALNNDEVLFTLINKRTEEATVLKILKRNTNYLIGTVISQENSLEKTLLIYNQKLQKNHVIFINPEIALENSIVVSKIISFDNNIFTVKIEKILGNINDPGVDILSVMHEFGIKANFEPATLLSANIIPQIVTERDLEKRIDLRNEILVTIDGKDAKDFDDAISVTTLDNGNYRLIVAIADVSYYVKAGDSIDNEAFERGTSVYLADRVVPMLPVVLSNGICSLNEQIDRLCMVSDMIINSQGITVSSKIYQAVMKSKRRMNYDEVNDAYNNLNPRFINTHPDVWKMLQQAKKLYQVLARYKTEQGVIDFEINEAKVLLNQEGQVTDVVLRTRDIAEKLIESFMIRANEVVSKIIFDLKLPFIYRVHESPKQKKMSQMLTILKLMGLNFNFKNESITSKDLQNLLNSIKDSNNFQILSTLLLRTMEKARYSNKNIGHFGLASTCYTHFTSPIRRYPDLVVHRLLRQYLIAKDKPQNFYQKNLNFTALAAEQSSNTEVKAMECERAVDQMKKAEHMSKLIGKKFSGIISGVTSFGIFVELYNTIEGLIKLNDMKDDFYIFNEKSMVLVGERTKKQLRLGAAINIVVKSANKFARTIDFELDVVAENSNKNSRFSNWNNNQKFVKKQTSTKKKTKNGPINNIINNGEKKHGSKHKRKHQKY